MKISRKEAKKKRLIRKLKIWGKRIIFGFISIIIALFVATCGLFIYYSQDLPSFNNILLEYKPHQVIDVYDRKGRVISRLYKDEIRTVIPLNQIPKHVIAAFLAAEDPNFYSHPGFDAWQMVKGIWRNVLRFSEGKKLTGASTITMQLVKRLVVGPQASIKRKIQEIIIAYRLEKRLSQEKGQTQSKDEILYMYLNDIHFGEMTYGIYEGSKRLFGKEPKNLSVLEAAVLAAMPKAPNTYDPAQNLENSKNRTKEYVLKQMKDQGIITENDYLVLCNYPIEKLLKPQKYPYLGSAEHLVHNLIVPEKTKVLKDNWYRCGHSCDIRLTLDADMQEQGLLAVRQGVHEIDRRSGVYYSPLAGTLYDKNVTELQVNKTYKAFVMGQGKVRVGKIDGQLETSWVKNWKYKLLPGYAVLATCVRVGKTPAFRLENVPQIQAALVTLSPKTGEVLAYVDGPYYEFDKARHLEGEIGRQIGSSGKPIVASLYMSSKKLGIDSVVSNQKTIFMTDCLQAQLSMADYQSFASGSFSCDQVCRLNRIGTANKQCFDSGQNSQDNNARLINVCDVSKRKLYSPSNHGNEYSESVTVIEGVAKSINVAAVNMLCDIGTRQSVVLSNSVVAAVCNGSVELYRRKMKEMFDLDIPKDTGLSAALGAIDVQPIKLAAMFNVFGSSGFYMKPYYIMEEAAVSKKVMSAAEAYRGRALLAAVINFGTGARAAQELKEIRNKGGKTGTTNENKDAWFNGITPETTTTVWVGYNEPRPIALGRMGEGSRNALPIWIYFMQGLLNKNLINSDASWPMPSASEIFESRGGIEVVDKKEEPKEVPQEESEQEEIYDFAQEYF